MPISSSDLIQLKLSPITNGGVDSGSELVRFSREPRVHKAVCQNALIKLNSSNDTLRR
jgi:hypothetical protein